MQKVLELAGHATAEAGFADWWWKERLGKAYYQLGLLRDGEKQLASAAKNQVGACRRCLLPHIRASDVKMPQRSSRQTCRDTLPCMQGCAPRCTG
jgi:hypothetical protein